MSRWVLDSSARPRVVLHVDAPHDGSAPDFDSLLAALGDVRAQAEEERLRLVFDITGLRPDARRRMRFVEWLRREGGKLFPRIDALALVAPSAVLRGVITAVRWFFPQWAFRTETFASREEAIAWIDARRS